MNPFYKILWLLFLAPLLFFSAVYAISETKLRDVNFPAPFKQPLPTDEASLDHGRHLLRTRGCFGCHGQQLEGRVFDYWPWVERAVAPNLAAYAKKHSAATTERAIRHGIGADGKALWSMPSYNFKHLSDSDVAAIIAYLSKAPVTQKTLVQPSLGLRARWAIVTGREEHMPQWIQRLPDLKVDSKQNPQLARGEYLAMTTCNECHGLDLKGDTAPDIITPDLTVIIQAYSKNAFAELMKKGISLDGRTDLGLMSVVAKDRFAHFTEQELTDLYTFLKTASSLDTY